MPNGELMGLRHTRAIIDLDALEHNLSLLAARVPGSGVAPAVKADAYGHGVEAIAGACESWGASMLVVANLQEYQYLRDLGVSIPILLLEEIFSDEIDAALREGARLTVASRAFAAALSDAALRAGATATVHINVDTGMGRMGLLSSDPVGDILAIASLPQVTVEGIFTHFPDSDEAEKAAAYAQLDSFDQLLSQVRDAGFRPRYTHVANSGALIDFPGRVARELVRPGVAAYGMVPSGDVDQGLDLRPVMRLQSRVIKITRYDRRWTVGYGRTWAVSEGARVAIVPIGYGDGYPRALSSVGHVLIGGRRCRIAGRVSMDMIAVDITEHPGEVAVGAPVVLVGSQGGETISMLELAEATGTITYEISCDITRRVPRVFLRGGRVVAVRTERSGYREIAPTDLD